MGHRGTFAIPPLVNFDHFRKVNDSQRAPDGASRANAHCLAQCGFGIADWRLTAETAFIGNPWQPPL